MNKKRILALVVTLTILLPTSVFAKGNGNNENRGGKPAKQEVKVNTTNNEAQAKDTNATSASTKGQEKKQEAQQKRDEKKQQKDGFKAQMKAKHEQMKQIRQQTIALTQQIDQKKSQLSTIISDIEAGKKTLPEDKLNSLLALAENLGTDGDNVKATAEINSQVSSTQTQVNSESFNNALASMDKVIAKMQARLDALNKLNTDLDAALEIANSATVPSTDENTVDTTTGGTATTGTTTDTTAVDNTNTTTDTTTTDTANTTTTGGVQATTGE